MIYNKVLLGWGWVARVARQGGGSGPDTPPANPDSTSGCTASILASGKALVHICWTSDSDSGPLFALIKREVEGCGGEGSEDRSVFVEATLGLFV